MGVIRFHNCDLPRADWLRIREALRRFIKNGNQEEAKLFQSTYDALEPVMEDIRRASVSL